MTDKPKYKKLREEFEKKFEEIGAKDIYETLITGTEEELKDKFLEYDGDANELKKLINSFKKAKEALDEESGGWAKIIAKFEDSNTTKIEAIKEAANYLVENYEMITFEDTKNIWIFTNPTYEERGEIIIEQDLEEHLQKYLRNSDVEEVKKSVKRMTYENRRELEDKKRYIALKNGWYDLEEDELVDPSPEHFIRNEIPVEYNEEADCPKIREFISEVVDEENVPVIQEIIGYCMYRDYPVGKAFMFLGSGKNGKSTLLNLIEKFLGQRNIASPSLQELLKNEFNKLDLKDKLANIHADLSSKKLQNTGTFKMLTGQDLISGKIKHVQGEFKFKNYAKLIYSANELPPTRDVTDAFFRRWIIINFPHKFTEDPNDGHKDKDPSLPDSILDEEELSGLFNWALKGLKRVLKNSEFTTTDSMEKIKEKWLTRTNPLQVFLEKHVEFKENAEIPKKDFRDALNDFCESHDARTYKLQTITKELQRKVPGFDTTRPTIEGDRVNCYKGLIVKEKYNSHVRGVKVFENYYNNDETVDPLSLINKKTPDRSDKGLKKYENNQFSNLNTIEKKVVTKVKYYSEKNESDLAYINEVFEDLDMEDQDKFFQIVSNLKEDEILYEPKNGMIGILK